MSLLRKASIVTTPTSYENGKILSVKPSIVLGNELVTNGDFATDSDWTKGTGWSISGGKAIYTGTTNSDLAQSGILTSGKSYKLEYEVVSSTLVNGIVKLSGASASAQNLLPQTTGVHSLNFIANGTAPTSFNIRIVINTSGQFKIDNVSVKELIDADFDFTRNSSATRVNSQGLIEDITSNLPRIDYTGGAGHWLFEPQSTNLIPYSEDFTQSTWGKQSGGVASAPVVTSNYSISPDGTLNADRVVLNVNGGTTSSDFSQLAESVTSNVGDVTNSVWLKSNTSSNYDMTFVNALGSTISIAVTTEWKRFILTSTTTTTSSVFKLRLRGSESTSDFADVSVWGAQIEEQSFATSYIPTSGAISTRLQDAAFGAGSSDLINSTEGVLYAEIAALANDQSNRRITISDGTNTNRIVTGYNTTSNQIFYFVVVGGSTVASGNYTSSDITQYSKIAIKFKANDFALWVDGIERHTDTSGAIFNADTLSSLQLQQGSGGALYFFGKTKCVAVFKEALTDAELTCLTTI